MPYLGQGSCLIENTRFFALRLYKVERQSSTNIYKSIRTCTNTSFRQFDGWCKIYESLQSKQKNVNKACLSIDNKTQRRKDAENPSIRQRVSGVRESWPTSQPMAHLKTFVGRFILQVSIKL